MTLYIDSAFLNDIMNVAQTMPLAGAFSPLFLIFNCYCLV